jgi:hypothetical protein
LKSRSRQCSHDSDFAGKLGHLATKDYRIHVENVFNRAVSNFFLLDFYRSKISSWSILMTTTLKLMKLYFSA